MATRLLITGGCGFLGSHLVEHFLKTTDYEIVILDKLTYASSGFDRLRDIAVRAVAHPTSDRVSDVRANEHPRVKLIGCDLSQPIPDGVRQEVGAIDYVIHAAAETHVDNSIVDPMPFIKSNVLGTHHLLWWFKSIATPAGLAAQGRRTGMEPKRIFLVSTDEVYGPAAWDSPGNVETDPFRPANPYAAAKAGGEAIGMAYANTYKLPITIVNCWDMNTRVLAEHGPRAFDQLNIGDLVWTLDEHEQMTLTPVLDKVRMRGPSKMIRFGGHAEQLVTPNHRMMFRASTGKPRRWGDIQEAHAENLHAHVPAGRVQFVRNGEWSGVSRDTYNTEDLIERVDHERVGRSGGKPGNRLPDSLPASWLARFYGWFVTEGSASASGQVRLAGAKPGQQEVLRALLEEIGMERIGASERTIFVSSLELAQLALKCGGTQDVRRVPKFIKQMAPAYLDEFLDAAFAGDGTWYVNAGRIYTMQEALAYDYAEIGMKCGYSAQVSTRVTKTFDGQSESMTYYTNLARRSTSEIGSQNITEEAYDGDVWCVKVTTGRVFTMRNEGGIVLTGQTMNLYGERQHHEKFIPLVIRRALLGEKVLIHADPSKTKSGTRFYIHCRNYASALAWLIHRNEEIEEKRDMFGKGTDQHTGWGMPLKLHVSGEREISNLDLAQMIASYVGKPLNYELVDFHSSRPGHDLRYALDDSKIRSMGWSQPVDIDASLKKTVEWYLREENRRWLGL